MPSGWETTDGVYLRTGQSIALNTQLLSPTDSNCFDLINNRFAAVLFGSGNGPIVHKAVATTEAKSSYGDKRTAIRYRNITLLDTLDTVAACIATARARAAAALPQWITVTPPAGLSTYLSNGTGDRLALLAAVQREITRICMKRAAGPITDGSSNRQILCRLEGSDDHRTWHAMVAAEWALQDGYYLSTPGQNGSYAGMPQGGPHVMAAGAIWEAAIAIDGTSLVNGWTPAENSPAFEAGLAHFEAQIPTDWKTITW